MYTVLRPSKDGPSEMGVQRLLFYPFSMTIVTITAPLAAEDEEAVVVASPGTNGVEGVPASMVMVRPFVAQLAHCSVIQSLLS